MGIQEPATGSAQQQQTPAREDLAVHGLSKTARRGSPGRGEQSQSQCSSLHIPAHTGCFQDRGHHPATTKPRDLVIECHLNTFKDWRNDGAGCLRPNPARIYPTRTKARNQHGISDSLFWFHALQAPLAVRGHVEWVRLK